MYSIGYRFPSIIVYNLWKKAKYLKVWKWWRCLLLNILKIFLCLFEPEKREKTKQNEQRKNDWFEIATNHQSSRPTDNRYFLKFYARSIFFSLLLEGLISRQIPWFKFCRLKRFSCFTLRTVVAIACWLTISEKYYRKFSPKLYFHSHLMNTSLINVPHRAICVVAIAIVISLSFPFFFSHSTMFLLIVF